MSKLFPMNMLNWIKTAVWRWKLDHEYRKWEKNASPEAIAELEAFIKSLP